MRHVISSGHEFLVFKAEEGTVDFYAYDTLFLSGIRLSTSVPLEPLEITRSSDEVVITYSGEGIRAVRRVKLGGGYRERVIFFSRADDERVIEGRYVFTVPMADILERDYPQASPQRKIEREGNVYAYLGMDGRRRTVRISGESFRVSIPPRGFGRIEFSATPFVEGEFLLPTFRKASFQFNWKPLERVESAVYLRAIEDLEQLIVDIDGYPFPLAGLPDFGAVFGRDSIWTALFLLEEYPQIARGVLKVLSRLQGKRFNAKTEEEPGKIPHEFRFGELCQAGVIPFNPYYGTVDATPLYVALAGEYLKRTEDRAFLDSIKNNLNMAVEWILRRLEEGGGYIRYDKTPLGLENQGWKDWKNSIPDENGVQVKHPVAVVEVQGYAYLALKTASELNLTDYDEKMLEKTAERLKRRFNKEFWTGEHYGIALDGENRLSKVVSSNMGHLLITGILPEERARAVAERLIEGDMFSGWGIRTLSSKERAYDPFSYHNGSVWPHDNAIIVLGLWKAGFKNQALKLASSLLNALYRLGKIPELFSGLEELTPLPYANSPQAWSAAGAVELINLMEVKE
ncbi:amylo-alpha-1,6-glucosidase [Thermococcus pacificus]|nr:amylo-alpha-1,6-glucosidase [Thermococcus pacificus]